MAGGGLSIFLEVLDHRGSSRFGNKRRVSLELPLGLVSSWVTREKVARASLPDSGGGGVEDAIFRESEWAQRHRHVSLRYRNVGGSMVNGGRRSNLIRHM